jgi:hypothetical protein
MDEDRTVTAVFTATAALFYEDFEDIAGWTRSGLWHVRDGQQACLTCDVLDGKFAYYARTAGCDYSTGSTTSGTLTSPVILLGGAKSVELHFDYFRSVEPATLLRWLRDITYVQVKLGRGMWKTLWSRSNLNRSPDCTTQILQIATSGVATMQVRFVFGSVDKRMNTYPGWGIDNVRVVPSGAAAPASMALADPVPQSASALDGLHVLNYPNPVRDVHTTTFAVRGTDVARVHLRIFDLTGHLVYEAQTDGNEIDWHTDSFDGEFLANGVYVYTVEALVGDDWVLFPPQTMVILK